MNYTQTLPYLCVALALFTPGQLKAQRTIPVTVTDQNGKPVAGLKAENFNISDDQKAQQIVSFTNADTPFAVGVVLDLSSGMKRTPGMAKAIVLDFGSTSNRNDEFMLVNGPASPFSTDIAALGNRADASATPEIALVDTIFSGVSRMSQAHQPRRALLIVSDGVDKHSQHSQQELLRAALEANVQVYSMILEGSLADSASAKVPFRPSMVAKPWDQGREHQQEEILEKLSAKTGGLYLHVHTSAELQEALATASDAMRNQYVIGYNPTQAGEAGKLHQIHVKSNVAKVNVYAQSGFVAH